MFQVVSPVKVSRLTMAWMAAITSATRRRVGPRRDDDAEKLNALKLVDLVSTFMFVEQSKN